MEILKSSILNDYDKAGEEMPILGGLYGSNGFFFQQRRGHLNLRAVASINLDKLVREVDVDLLQSQIENITFCNLREEDLRYLTDPQIVKLFRVSQLMIEYLLYSQDQLVENLNKLSVKYSEKKRGLSRKRRDLVELEEATKLLRNQIKAKKQNISTLEDLLKETNKNREKDLRNIKRADENVSTVEFSKQSTLKFFIVGPEGLCVEFSMRVETEIYKVLKEARKAFISKRDLEQISEEDVEMKLIFKGKVLLESQTIESSDIHSGDTIMALLSYKKESKESVVLQSHNTIPEKIPVSSQEDTKSMIEFLSKQQHDLMKELAHDINNSWQTAIHSLSNANAAVHQSANKEKVDENPHILADMNNRWNRAELGLREKISQLESQQAIAVQELSSLSILANRRKLKLGDLESDTDDGQKSDFDIGPLNSRIDNLQKHAINNSTDLENLKSLIKTQTNELAELKNLLAQQKAYKPISPQITTLKPVREVMTMRSNKWNDIPGATNLPTTIETKVDKVTVAEITPTNQPTPVIKLEIEQVKPIKVVEQMPIKLTSDIKEPIRNDIRNDTIDIVFPIEHNPFPKIFDNKNFQVNVKRNISVDKLIKELREAAAKEAKSSFEKVVLSFKGKRVASAADIDPSLQMSANDVIHYALSGELCLLIGAPLTSTQIDMLTSSWGLKEKLNESQKSKIKREWKDEKEVSDYTNLRNSLDEVLSELSEKEGLTEDEYKTHVNKLNEGFTNKLPENFSKDLRKFRGSVASALAATAADSGSETVRNSGSGDEVLSRSRSTSLQSRNRVNSKSSSLGKKESSNNIAGIGLLRPSTNNNDLDQSRSSINSFNSSNLRRSEEQFEKEFGNVHEKLNNVLKDYEIAQSALPKVDNSQKLVYTSPPTSVHFKSRRYNLDESDEDESNTAEINRTNFDEGDVVELNYMGKGKWLKGTINIARLDGTYDIHCIDGEREKNVTAECIRKPENSTESSVITADDKVRTNWNKVFNTKSSFDSVDSAKREYLSNRIEKQIIDVGESKDNFKGTGELSSIQTFDDSIATFNDEDDVALFENTVSTTGHSISTTVVKQQADAYERDAKYKSHYTHKTFIEDDDSLALSDSNNYD